jgi:glycosyltransferase 2 family protein
VIPRKENVISRLNLPLQLGTFFLRNRLRRFPTINIPFCWGRFCQRLRSQPIALLPNLPLQVFSWPEIASVLSFEISNPNRQISVFKIPMSSLKPYLRWFILTAVLCFLGNTLVQHWHEVSQRRITGLGWGMLAIALGITLLAHITAGWVWSVILRELGQAATGSWGARVYLRTNIAKYLPGNIWHFYGRIVAARNAGISWKMAGLSVLMEVPLMVAAALLMGLWGIPQWGSWPGWLVAGGQSLGLVGVLLSVHPRCLNPVLGYLGKLKQQVLGQDSSAFPTIQRYPWLPLLGEFGFLGLRGVGFVLTFGSLCAVPLAQIPLLFSAYSLAWLLGFAIPGLPGGVGVLEAVAIALLSPHFPPADLIGTLALYRLINTLAETMGAGLAVLSERHGAVGR